MDDTRLVSGMDDTLGNSAAPSSLAIPRALSIETSYTKKFVMV